MEVVQRRLAFHSYRLAKVDAETYLLEQPSHVSSDNTKVNKAYLIKTKKSRFAKQIGE